MSQKQDQPRITRRLVLTLPVLSILAVVVTIAWQPWTAVAQTTPNDPLFPSQYNLREIKAAEAWDVTRGSASIKVAIVDTGVASDPGELGEFDGQLGQGFNSIDGSDTEDKYGSLGQGTLRAGIIGAKADNGQAIAGIAWNVTMLPVKACDDNGVCAPSSVAAGINWALDQGAQIIHISPNDRDFQSQEVDGAISRALTEGALVVSAAGSAEEGVTYPASLPGVIAVSGIDGNQQTLWGGGTALDLVAPAQSVYTLRKNACCAITLGPSDAAAPQVTGALALLLAAGVPASEAPGALYAGAKDYGPDGWDPDYGWGRLDICGALHAAGIACPVGISPTNTPTKTNTPVPPTNTPTNTPVPPTNTPTNTPVPSTNTPTNTPVPPTNTPTNTPVPPTNTPANTPVPPTNTRTSTNTPTNTPTVTPVGGTATPTPCTPPNSRHCRDLEQPTATPTSGDGDPGATPTPCTPPNSRQCRLAAGAWAGQASGQAWTSQQTVVPLWQLVLMRVLRVLSVL